MSDDDKELQQVREVMAARSSTPAMSARRAAATVTSWRMEADIAGPRGDAARARLASLGAGLSGNASGGQATPPARPPGSSTLPIVQAQPLPPPTTILQMSPEERMTFIRTHGAAKYRLRLLAEGGTVKLR